MQSSKSSQADLFAATDFAESKGLKIMGSTRQLDPHQRRFNELLGKISAIKDEIAAWKSVHQILEGEFVTALIANETLIGRLKIESLLVMEAMSFEKAAKAKLGVRFQRLHEAMVAILESVPSSAHDADWEALLGRLMQKSKADLVKEELSATQEAFVSEFGEQFLEGFEGASVEDFAHFARAKLENAAPPEPEPPPRAQGKRKNNSAAAKQAQVQSDLKQTLREVFRKLASALHPDREKDSATREQKTELMQRVNNAYAADDLLALLLLQVEVAQLDAASMRELPQARLISYNTTLNAQYQELQKQLHAAQAASYKRFQAELPRGAKRATENHLREQIRAEKKHLESYAQQLGRDLASLKDPSRRWPLLREIISAMMDDDAEMDQEFEEFLREISAPTKSRKRRR